MTAFSQITAVVLAGGQGKRIRHLLPDCPKPMAPVLDRPFLEWIARYLAVQGVRRIIISTGYKAQIIGDHFQSVSIPEVEISCVCESEPLGTAGGFLEAISSAPTSEAWLVCNGDSLVLTSFRLLFQALQKNEISGALFAIPMADTSSYGTLQCDDQGLLQRFNEKHPGSGLINAGVYLFRSALVPDFSAKRPLSFETEVFPALLSAGCSLQVVPASGPFLDIGTPETLEKASQFIAENLTFFDSPDRPRLACADPLT